MSVKKGTGALQVATTMLFVAPVANVAQTPQTAQIEAEGLHITGGKLYVGEELAKKGFSVFQSRFSFLFVYVPDHGLWIISAREFEGAVEAGRFLGSQLAFDLEGTPVRIESSDSILGSGEVPAWVKHDPAMSLDVKSVIIGYGDRETVPYAWPSQIGAR